MTPGFKINRCSRTIVALLLTAGWFFFNACRRTHHTNLQTDHQENSPLQQFIGESLLRLAAEPAFFISKSSDDSQPTAMVSLKAAGWFAWSFNLDFTPYLKALQERKAAEVLAKVVTFPTPSGPAMDLGNRQFVDLLMQELFKEYAKLSDKGESGAKAFTYTTAYQRALLSCKKSGFAENTPHVIPLPAGDTVKITINCRMFRRQQTSALTLTYFEGKAIGLYTQEFYKQLNQLTRARSFQYHTLDEALAVDSSERKLSGLDTLIAMGVISALNKLDPEVNHTYRGLRTFFKSCDVSAPEAVFSTSTSKQQSVDQFCSYTASLNTYTECSFISTSRNPQLSMMFAGILRNKKQLAELDKNGPDFIDTSLPTTGEIPIIFEINGKSGHDIRALSEWPHEEEVLFKPGTRFQVKPQSGMLALKIPPKLLKSNYNNYQEFDLVPCGQKLSDQDLKRLSHFRLSFFE